MNKIKTIYEFLVWDNCNNNCKFCFQRINPKTYMLQQQEQILNNVITYINSDQFENNNHILICGGELFDDHKRIDIIKNFFQSILYLAKNGIIDLIYINTNLLYELNNIVECLIPIFKSYNDNNILERIRFTTSYDIYGRFSSVEKQKLFLQNLQYIKQTIPELNIVVNMILTKQFCKSIINDQFNIFDFCKNYNISVNLIPYIILNDELIPTQSDLYTALQMIYLQNPQYMIKWLNELDLKQKRIMLTYVNNKFQSCECDLSECGHSENFKRYTVKNNSCFVCDLKYIFNSVI